MFSAHMLSSKWDELFGNIVNARRSHWKLRSSTHVRVESRKRSGNAGIVFLSRCHSLILLIFTSSLPINIICYFVISTYNIQYN